MEESLIQAKNLYLEETEESLGVSDSRNSFKAGTDRSEGANTAHGGEAQGVRGTAVESQPVSWPAGARLEPAGASPTAAFVQIT